MRFTVNVGYIHIQCSQYRVRFYCWTESSSAETQEPQTWPFSTVTWHIFVSTWELRSKPHQVPFTLGTMGQRLQIFVFPVSERSVYEQHLHCATYCAANVDATVCWWVCHVPSVCDHLGNTQGNSQMAQCKCLLQVPTLRCVAAWQSSNLLHKLTISNKRIVAAHYHPSATRHHTTTIA